MTSIWDLANPQLRDLAVYEPGKPIEETARELGVDPAEIVKLASNENPLGPSPKGSSGNAGRALKFPSLSRWKRILLVQGNRDETWPEPENVILGNGSNEVIEFLGHAFLNPGDDVITCQYAFIV